MVRCLRFRTRIQWRRRGGRQPLLLPPTSSDVVVVPVVCGMPGVLTHYGRRRGYYTAQRVPAATTVPLALTPNVLETSILSGDNDDSVDHGHRPDDRVAVFDRKDAIDVFTNDVLVAIEEIISYQDTIRSADAVVELQQKHQQQRKAEGRRSVRDRWRKNMEMAKRFEIDRDSDSYTYVDSTKRGMLKGNDSDTFPESRVASDSNDDRTFVDAHSIVSDEPVLAVYHALKNDFQVGGELEEVIALPTKVDPVPFASLDTLLESVETPAIEIPEWSSAIHEPVNILSSPESTLATPLQIPDVDEKLLTTSTEQIVATNHPAVPLSETDATAHSVVRPWTFDSWFQGDSSMKSITEQTKSETQQRLLSLDSWFQSELLGHETVMADEEHRHVSEQNTTTVDEGRREAVIQALVLLRTLNEAEWTSYDRPLGKETVTVADKKASENEAEREHVQHEEGTDAYTDEIDRIEPGSDSLDLLSDVLLAARAGRVQPTTLDYNVMFARMAIATDIAPDRSLNALMETYQQMVLLSNAGFNCQPNATTYEILLLSLIRRFAAFQSAIDLVVSIVKSPELSWTPKTLEATMMLCERKSLTEMAQSILSELQSGRASDTEIPKRVYHSFMNVFKADDARSSAIEALRLALKRANHSRDEALDSVFVNAVKWPTKNRYSRSIDNSSVIADILELLEEERVYVAGYAVWKQIVVSSASGANQSLSRWNFVVRALRCLSVVDPTFWPDHTLLKHGLSASEAMRNSDLASDLLWRSIEYYPVPSPEVLGLKLPQDGIAERLSPMYIKPHIPYQDILKAMAICLSTKDMDSCTKILRCADRLDLTTENLRSLYMLCLRGCATIGNTNEAERLFSTMQEKGMDLREDSYGSLMHAYSAANQLDKARALLRSLESGELGIQPGQMCYDGFIVGCIRHQAWDDATVAYESMLKLNVVPSPVACHGIMLASIRQGGRVAAKSLLGRFVSAGSLLHKDGVILAVKALIPGVAQEPLSIAGIRDHLRMLIENDVSTRPECLNLTRSLRMADMEEERVESPGLSMDAILSRRNRAWQTVMEDLLVYANAADAQENSERRDA